ncbi:hypothetical protein ACOBQX_29215 [Actinokineospora sp. G85]|uniref:hypothetical protein n=1 Tax=Actinokineospora sp. G85 TaxID=3406626 RepID=UPI003C7069CB
MTLVTGPPGSGRSAILRAAVDGELDQSGTWPIGLRTKAGPGFVAEAHRQLCLRVLERVGREPRDRWPRTSDLLALLVGIALVWGIAFLVESRPPATVLRAWWAQIVEPDLHLTLPVVLTIWLLAVLLYEVARWSWRRRHGQVSRCARLWEKAADGLTQPPADPAAAFRELAVDLAEFLKGPDIDGSFWGVDGIVLGVDDLDLVDDPAAALAEAKELTGVELVLVVPPELAVEEPGVAVVRTSPSEPPG